MTWSYSIADLATSAKDQVRAQIGDVLSTDPQLQDEEIATFITGRGSILGACADCCRAIASKFSRSVTQKAGGSAANFSDLAKAYREMALQFEARAAAGGSALPYAGGISNADKLSQELNDDRVSPQFAIGMDDALLPVPPVGIETQTDALANDTNDTL